MSADKKINIKRHGKKALIELDFEDSSGKVCHRRLAMLGLEEEGVCKLDILVPLPGHAEDVSATVDMESIVKALLIVIDADPVASDHRPLSMSEAEQADIKNKYGKELLNGQIPDEERSKVHSLSSLVTNLKFLARMQEIRHLLRMGNLADEAKARRGGKR